MPVFLLTLAVAIAPVKAFPIRAFLDSIGVNSAISVRGESVEKTVECAKYLGLGWFRSGYESGVTTADQLRVFRESGARFSYGLGSGGTDLPKLLEGGRTLAKAGALIAFEGPNEPNNWGFTYKGETGGGSKTWKPVAALQRDLYSMVKSDPLLKKYPVWGASEMGAMVDNVGLQFLTVPKGAGTEVPDGTKYADAANVHNYIYHPNSPAVEDNKTWNASDPSSACKVDGLYGNHGLTWGRKYKGYSEKDLENLPKVTTETGCTIGGEVTEEIHALNLMSLYLDQFKRGWSHTAVYLLRDRVDEGGNQQFGFYESDYTPRKAAVYLHNLTTILTDTPPQRGSKPISYSIPSQPDTVHDLLFLRSDGTYVLVVWSEKVKGTNEVQVRFNRPTGGAKIYDPTVGTSAIRKVDFDDSLSLTLSDHPLIVEIGK